MEQFRSFPKPEARAPRPRFEPSYRNRRQQNDDAWTRKREEEEKKRQEEEAERKKLEMNEKNFPSLGAGAPVSKGWGGEQSFANLASDWKRSDDIAKLREERRKRNEERERNLNNGVFVWRPQRSQLPEDEYEEEPEYMTSQRTDSDGWTTVENKVQKQKKQMTDAELERYFSQTVNEDGEEDDFNGDLPDASRREFY
jgi:hypothetical protein